MPSQWFRWQNLPVDLPFRTWESRFWKWLLAFCQWIGFIGGYKPTIVIYSIHGGYKPTYHRIGWWEHLQENTIFDGKFHGFRFRFSLKPIHWFCVFFWRLKMGHRQRTFFRMMDSIGYIGESPIDTLPASGIKLRFLATCHDNIIGGFSKIGVPEVSPDAPCMVYLPTFGWLLGQM